MKRTRFLAVGFAVMLLGGAVTVTAQEADPDNSQEQQVEQWHEAVQREYSAIQSGETEEELQRYALEAAIKAYELQGSHDAAVEKAKEVWGRNMALYLAALEDGIQVTVEEVEEDIEEYKSIFTEQEASEEADLMKGLMESFPSEEEFWEYQAAKSKISLTVKKYLKGIGKDYAEEIGMDIDSSFFPIRWHDKLEDVKTEALEEYKEEIEGMFTE